MKTFEKMMSDCFVNEGNVRMSKYERDKLSSFSKKKGILKYKTL